MINTNTWNRIMFTLGIPFYDLVAARFRAQRKLSAELAQIDAGSKVLLLGAGTGLDLEFLEGCNITAVDLTPAMLRKLQRRAKALQIKAEAVVMNAHHLDFPDEHFDVVLLHFVLAVITRPNKCMAETERVLKKGGAVMVVDLFLPDDVRPGILRRLINIFTSLATTSINRKFGTMMKSVHLTVEQDIWCGWRKQVRIVKLRK